MMVSHSLLHVGLVVTVAFQVSSRRGPLGEERGRGRREEKEEREERGEAPQVNPAATVARIRPDLIWDDVFRNSPKGIIGVGWEKGEE